MTVISPPPGTRQADAVGGISSPTPGTAWVASATEASLYAFTIPANTLAIGTTYEVLLYGQVILSATASNHTYRWRVGGVGDARVVCMTGVAAVTYGAAAIAYPGRALRIYTQFTVRATGVSGSLIGLGEAHNYAAGTRDNQMMIVAAAPGAVTMDTTIANTIHFTAVSSVAAAGTTTQFLTGVVLLSRL